MLSLTVYTGANDTHSFICSSFKIGPSGGLVIHFDNGLIRIDKDAFDELIVYPHNTVDTNVFDPGLLNSTRR